MKSGSDELIKQEILERFGNVPLKFAFYYKYRFTFEGRSVDGYTVVAWCGGDASDIYRFEVKPERIVKLNDMDCWHDITVRDSDGQVVLEWWTKA